MNGIPKKLAAFTIMELMVVSAFTVITASAVFSAVGIFDKLFADYQQEAGNEIKLFAFKEKMNSDFQTCEKAELIDNTLFLSGSKNKIGYELSDSHIFRITLDPMRILDSLIYPNFNYQAFYKEEPVTNHLIDQLIIEFQDETVLRTINLIKNYSSQEKLNYTATN